MKLVLKNTLLQPDQIPSEAEGGLSRVYILFPDFRFAIHPIKKFCVFYEQIQFVGWFVYLPDPRVSQDSASETTFSTLIIVIIYVEVVAAAAEKAGRCLLQLMVSLVIIFIAQRFQPDYHLLFHLAS